MDTIDMTNFSGAPLLLVFSALPLSGYACLYLVFRLCGTLRVNAGGWHACGLRVGGLVLASAACVMRLFQPLMSFESGLARRLWRKSGDEDEEEVQDVIVEVVPLT